MKYGLEIMQEIAEELYKVPNIRAVCKKVGINHSTFYRWMSQHYEFQRLITATMVMARETMTSAAEGVIIQGILRGDFKSAKYWLAHNDPRYSTHEQSMYLKHVNDNIMEELDKTNPDNPSEKKFDVLFDFYRQLEVKHEYEEGKAREVIDPYVKYITQNDSDLEELFFASYTEWKETRWNDISKRLDMKWKHKEYFGEDMDEEEDSKKES